MARLTIHKMQLLWGYKYLFRPPYDGAEGFIFI